jgi:hypothetical protein
VKLAFSGHSVFTEACGNTPERKSLLKSFWRQSLPPRPVSYISNLASSIFREVYMYTALFLTWSDRGVRFGYRIVRDMRKPGAFTGMIQLLTRSEEAAAVSKVMVVEQETPERLSSKISAHLILEKK